MRKKIRTALLLSGLISAIAPQVNAATENNDFTVAVVLESVCSAVDSGTKTLDFGTYTAFQGTAQTATGISIVFECTRGLTPISVAFDNTNGTDIGGGVVAGLNYDMDFGTAVIVSGTAATSGVGDIGTADTSTYALTGSMLAGQAGTDGATATQTRTLILTY